VDLMLVSPGLRDEQREEIFAALEGSERMLRIPVLAFSPAVEEGLFVKESSGATWPVDIGGLVRAIEAALGGKAKIEPAIVANALGGSALP
jgi:hypothetical protein